jgi:FAD/FMN-containing dehydrogenase
VEIDPETRVARIAAGTRWKSVVEAAAEHGLLPVTGSSTGVGVVGYTLGGGFGPLTRSHGLTTDWVRGFRVVLADGSVVEADAESRPDLFWALRGGKGGLGVVTELRIELVPLPTIYAGAIVFDTPHIETVLRGWIDWTASAPDDVTTSVAVIRFPDFDFVPEPIRGHHGIALRFAYPGGTAEGERLAAPLRALAPALLDGVGELPTSMMGVIHSDPTTPLPAWDLGGLLFSADQELATALLAQVGAGTHSPLMIAELRHLGGRAATDVPEGSAAGGRAGRYSFYAIGAPDPSLFEKVLPAAAERFLQAVEPWVSPETNVNFAGRFASREHFASAWPPEIFARLESVRRAYDPGGLFTYGPAAR